MSCCSTTRRAPLIATLLCGVAAPARAQGVQARGVRELQVHAAGVASRPFFGGAGGGVAFRDADRNRWQGALALGLLDGGGVGARGDFVYHFLLDPRKRQGSAVYGGHTGTLIDVTEPGGRVWLRVSIR